MAITGDEPISSSNLKSVIQALRNALTATINSVSNRVTALENLTGGGCSL